MNDVRQDKGDGKLLIAVAGLVVAGAAGIALIGGLSAQRRAASAAQENAVAVAPMPASFVRSAPEIAPIEEEEVKVPGTVSPEIETRAEPFVLDPQADFVAAGLAAYRGREFAKAAAYFEGSAERNEEDAWVWYMLSLSLWKDGRSDAAVEAMRRSIDADPARVKAFVNLSRIHNDRGAFDAALEAADEALALAPDNAEALFVRSRSLHNLRRIDDALTALEASLALDPDNGHAHNLLGLIRIEQGHAEPAAAALEQAVLHAPDVAYIQNNLGMALELCGRDAEALAAYRRAVELDAAHARAQLNLARLAPAATGDAPDTEPPVEAIDPVAELGEPEEAAASADSGIAR